MTTPALEPRTTMLQRLLPRDASRYEGPRMAVVALGAYVLLLIGRSLVHMFAPDGGAQSIATIDVDVAGGANIVAIFGQWGAIQLILALVVALVIWRYRGLVPLMALALALEPVLRFVVGQLKPITTMATAPGEAVNNYVIPVLLALFVVSLLRRTTDD